jgi:hypothetical protein
MMVYVFHSKEEPNMTFSPSPSSFLPKINFAENGAKTKIAISLKPSSSLYRLLDIVPRGTADIDKSNVLGSTEHISLTAQLSAKSRLVLAGDESSKPIKKRPSSIKEEIAESDINLANIRGPFRLPCSAQLPAIARTFSPLSVDTASTHLSVATYKHSPFSGKLKLLAPLAPVTASGASGLDGPALLL